MKFAEIKMAYGGPGSTGYVQVYVSFEGRAVSPTFSSISNCVDWCSEHGYEVKK